MSNMFGLAQGLTPERVLVVMPTWLGDCVMASPTLRALRGLYPQAQIVALIGADLMAVYEPCPFVDRIESTPQTGREPRPQAEDGARPGRAHHASAGPRDKESTRQLAKRLKAQRFDLAVLMPGSFRVALLAAWAGIPRRVGYSRDGRSMLLTDRLLARREKGRYLPDPARSYYLALARYLGARAPEVALSLSTDAESDQQAAAILGQPTSATRRPVVVLNPGAQKPTKRWPAQRFAALADRLIDQRGAWVAVSGSPSERAVVDAVIGGARSEIVDLTARGMNLKLLKAVLKQADLLITGDTGPRHIAAAVGTCVLTLFGPTDPRWTQIDFERERQIVAPGRLDSTDDSDHRRPGRTMDRIELDPVYDEATQLLDASW